MYNYIIMKVEINKVTDTEINLIKAAVQKKEPVEISLYSVSRAEEDTINRILLAVLEASDQSHLMSYLSYSTLELMANANKANTKRVYFQEKKLDINNPDDYQNGMLTFSVDTTVNKEHYKELLEAQNMYVNMLFTSDESITVEVTNKAQLTEVELKRINDKLERAKIYNTMDEALSDIDKTEGSGLGLIIIVLMLKQLGLGRDNLQFESSNGITSFSITIPMDTVECI